MPLFDTHSHIYLSKEKTESDIIVDIENDVNLKYIASIGTTLETSKHNIELSKKYPFIIPTIWIHPCHVEDYYEKREETFLLLESLLQESKVYAIGECGLDYYRLPPRLSDTRLEINKLKEIQKIFFIKQIHLAKKYSLPIIIHNRESREDILKILIETNCKNFVFHCYSEDYDFAKRLFNFAPNAMISFSGIVTFNNAKVVQETAKKIPLKICL